MKGKSTADLTHDQLDHEAEQLLTAFASGDAATVDEVAKAKRETIRDGQLTTRQAQRVVSRRYSIGWSDLQSHLELGPGVREVIEAVREADLDSLKTLLREHPRACNPYWPDRDRPPDPIPQQSIPLFAVCSCARQNGKRKTADLAQALIDAGADPDIRDSNPLTTAASFNQPEVTTALLDAGATLDGVKNDGSPIVYAVYFGPDVAPILAERGARLDLRTAAGLGFTDVMETFFDADGSLPPKASALRVAFCCNTPEHRRSEVLAQALIYASCNDHVAAAEMLLDRGTDIDAMPAGFDFASTALHRALRQRKTNVARLLIERGADLDIRDGRHKMNAVEWAILRELPDMISLIESQPT